MKAANFKFPPPSRPRRPILHKLSAAQSAASCNICGELLENSPHALLMHLLFQHPIEFFKSAHGQRILHNVSNKIFDFGKNMTGDKS